MSTFNEVDIECEKCGDEFKGTIWSAVHATQDPELKDLLLGGELNMVMCPHCAHVSFQDRFVLYQDPQAEIIAYVYPAMEEGNAKTLRVSMMQGFREAQEVFEPNQRVPYEPLLIFGLESLVELLNEEQSRAEQSQIAQEICKEQKIPYALLSPSAARKANTARVIPIGNKGTVLSRSTALDGIAQLLAINSALSLYVDLLKRIVENPAFAF